MRLAATNAEELAATGDESPPKAATSGDDANTGLVQKFKSGVRLVSSEALRLNRFTQILLGVIAGLAGLIYSDLKGDLGEIKSSQYVFTQDLNDIRDRVTTLEVLVQKLEKK